MKLLLLLPLLLFQIPKYNPDGLWEAESGSQYELHLNGSDLHIKMVPGSNPKFLEYELDAKRQDEINSYKGAGTFVARMDTGKECKLPTEWQIVVVSADRIIGVASVITADQETCEIKEKTQLQLNLKRKG